MVKPLGETRPAWKVLRVLANLLALPGFDFESSQAVLHQVPELANPQTTHVSLELLSNATTATVDLTPAATPPVVAGIYALDGLVRRAASLQLTADARSMPLALQAVNA